MRKQEAALVLLLILAAGDLAAQGWRGPAALGVEARSRKGKPVIGARVTLRYQGTEPVSGPPGVATDAKGRAVIANLAQGEWQLEVQHEDFLSYIAVVTLQSGRKPAVSASFLQAGGRSLTPMKVKFFRPGGQAPSPFLVPAEPEIVPPLPAPPPAPVVREEPVPPVPVEPKPAPAEPIQPQPLPAPTKPLQPQPEPPRREVAPPEPVPAPSPIVQPEPKPQQQDDAAPESPPLEPEPPVQPQPEVFPAEPEPEAQPATPTAETQPLQPTITVSPPLPSEPAPEEVKEVPVAAPTPVEEPAAPAPTDSPALPLPAAKTVPPLAYEPLPPTTAPSQAQPPVVPREPITPATEVPSEPAPAEPRPTEPAPSQPPEIQQVPEVAPPPAAAPPSRTEPEPTPTPPAAPERAAETVTPEVTEEPPAMVEDLSTTAITPPTPEPAIPEPLTPDPPPSTPPTPETPPSTPPRPAIPAPPRTGPSLRSAGNADCGDCKSGEWSVSSSQVAAASVGQAGPCPEKMLTLVRKAMEGIARSIHLELSIFAGPVADGSPAEALRGIKEAEVTAFRDGLTAAPAHCRAVAIVLPRAARFVGFRYRAADQAGSGDCLPGEDCVIGRARWIARPEIIRGSSSIVVYGIFKNLAEDRDRRGHLTVFFRPPSADWRPSVP